MDKFYQKKITPMLTLVTAIFIFACGQSSKQRTDLPKQDSLENRRLTKEEKARQVEAEHKRDSLRLEFALNNAFNIVKENLTTEHFNKEYELQPDDSSYTISIEITIADLFANNQKYFLLRRHVPWATYVDLYKISDRKSERVIVREQRGMTYVRDTIFDVNGDGLRDFLVHWYPSSGCCRRDIYNVYLNMPGG